jgi:protease-4
VATVAEGRDTTEAHIRDVAEGRIYSGLDGKNVGLVDEIGGLPRAIDLARTAAGLTPEESSVREVNPYSGTFNFGRVLPGPLGALFADPMAEEAPSVQDNPELTFLRLMLEHQPGPLVLLPPAYSTMAE